MSKFINLNDKSRASNCYSRLNEDAKVASNIEKCIHIVDKFNDELKKVYDVAIKTTQSDLREEFIAINYQFYNDIKKFRDNLNNIKQYEESSCKPKNLDELKKIVEKTIENNGPNCDLNFIDVSNITDMSYLFWKTKFDGDISKWNVSRVENMNGMFQQSEFSGDISKWNVSNVTDMKGVFRESKFNGDISKWNVSNVKIMNEMFCDSDFNGDISEWDVSNVKDMSYMFLYSKFNGDISKWNVSNVRNMNEMFCKSKFTGDISSWDVSNVKEMEGMFKESEFYDIRILSKWYPHKNVKYQIDVFDYSPLHGMHFKCFK